MSHLFTYCHNGLAYGVTLHGTLEECESHAERLRLVYDGELVEEIPVSDRDMQRISMSLEHDLTH